MKLKLRLSIGILVVACGLVPMSAAGAPPPLPNSMASAGDSITRAFDMSFWPWCFLTDCPSYSWSTGGSASLSSQYRRILARNPSIAGHSYNDAKTGANMSALDGQLSTAAGQGVQYVTILMGANDLCTSSIATMTPTATFKSEFQQALANFSVRDPGAYIYVSSLPDIYQLWKVLRTNPSAQSAWKNYNICQSMLSAANSEANRQAVVAQEAADNQALATVCAQVANCRWDNYAGYNFKFPASDVSTIDYFHPNLQGQNAVAATTWS
ncbi:MAG TPA: GDSL-type esterase/lipase family protein, partial [Candidatus Dormibacteraeota bacterium]